jgi:hypothetical protein
MDRIVASWQTDGRGEVKVDLTHELLKLSRFTQILAPEFHDNLEYFNSLEIKLYVIRVPTINLSYHFFD